MLKEKEAIKETFDKFDADHSNSIELDELKEALKSINGVCFSSLTPNMVSLGSACCPRVAAMPFASAPFNACAQLS